jgi:hypothetical protein
LRSTAATAKCNFRLFDDLPKGHPLQVQRTGLEPHVGERPIDQRLETHVAAIDDRAGAPPDGDDACLDASESEGRSAESVTQLVREEPEPLGPLIADGPLTLPRIRGHGARRGVVQT